MWSSLKRWLRLALGGTTNLKPRDLASFVAEYVWRQRGTAGDTQVPRFFAALRHLPWNFFDGLNPGLSLQRP